MKLRQTEPEKVRERQRAKMERRNCWKDVVPFTAMVTVECTNVGVQVLFKAATEKGLSYYVFIAYSFAVSTLVLLLPLPFFIQRCFFTHSSIHLDRVIQIISCLIHSLIGAILICEGQEGFLH